MCCIYMFVYAFASLYISCIWNMLGECVCQVFLTSHTPVIVMPSSKLLASYEIDRVHLCAR